MANYDVPSDRKNDFERLLIEYVKENENFTNAWHKSVRDRSTLRGELGFKFLDDGTLDVGFEKHNPSGQKKYDFNVGKNFGDNWSASVGAQRVTPQHGKHQDTYRAELKRRFLDGEAFIQGSTTGGDNQVDTGFKWKFDKGGFVDIPIENQLVTPYELHGTEAVRYMQQHIGPLTDIEKYIIEHEGYKPGLYKDSKGKDTSGVGQTEKYRNISFRDTVKDFVKKTKNFIPEYDNLPKYLQKEFVQAAYRGDLGLSKKTRKLFNKRQYKQAAEEFLNNEEYKNPNTPESIKKRMLNVRNAILKFSKKKK